MSLAEALERRAAVPQETIARVREATPRVQHLEGEKALARLAVDEGIATPDVVRELVEESKRAGFAEGIGVLLQRRGLLAEERARQLFQTRQVALAEARARREHALCELVSSLAPRFSPEEKTRLGAVFEIDETSRPAPIVVGPRSSAEPPPPS